MKHLTAICTGTPDGYRIRVLDEDHGVYLAHLFFDWDSFRPASAGHRLIEHGYMIRPDARTPDTVNGWRGVPGQPATWSVPVMPTNEGAPETPPTVAERLAEAVSHWTEGRHDQAQEILADLARNGTPSLMYGVATGLAVMAKAALAKLQGLDADTAFWIILTSDGSRPEDIVPQPHLFAARFITAFANGDTATTLALYGAAFTAPDPELFSHCLEMLLAATGEAVRAATPGGRSMTSSASYSPDGLRHDVADPATWSVRICAGRCGTCIFRPGNLMRLEEGRVAEMVANAIAQEGHIVCHATLGTDAPAICAGFAAHSNGRTASLALRLARARVLHTVWVHVDTRKVES